VKCRESVGYARELLGGNGILLDENVGPFVADAEAIHSYEGTREMNTLVASPQADAANRCRRFLASPFAAAGNPLGQRSHAQLGVRQRISSSADGLSVPPGKK
jgi:hypothetical protein